MATMLYVRDVTGLFRAYTDEPDLTFVTDADAQSYLEMGYNEFRQKVTSMAPATLSLLHI